jgi:hypothetical protein
MNRPYDRAVVPDLILRCSYLGGFAGIPPSTNEAKLTLSYKGYHLECPRSFWRKPQVAIGSWPGVNVEIVELSDTNFEFQFIANGTRTGRVLVPVHSSVERLYFNLGHFMGRHPGGVLAQQAEERRVKELADLRVFLNLTPSGFEHAVARILSANGYLNVSVKGGAGDLAADIVCRDSDGQSVVVQCKQYGTERKVTSQEMQLFIGMGRIEHRAERLLYVTTGGYTKAATELGRRHGVELFDGTQLESLGRESNKQ